MITKSRRLVVWGVVMLVILFVLLRLGYEVNWTGFNAQQSQPAKTLWDWLQLLIIPAVLAGGGFVFQRETDRTNREIETDRQQEEVLQAYLERMSELLLDKNLHNSQVNAEISYVVSVRTLTALRRINSSRKGDVLQYLYESDLLAITDLKRANLREVNLRKFDLSNALLRSLDLQGADLSSTDLQGADLSAANLQGADLSAANLQRADLSAANLRGADLSFANLRGADLSFANLRKAKLQDANLSLAHFNSAILREANLNSAKLHGTDLVNACLTDADLSSADLSSADLNWAILIGTTISDEQLGQVESYHDAIQ